MKKKYITPKTVAISAYSESICQGLVMGSDQHHSQDGDETEEIIPSGGSKDGEDFAKGYDAWTTWDE